MRRQTVTAKCIAKFHDDEDALELEFQLADDRDVSLIYPKPP
jgi:hypothetical protein